jgi:hypothetical protein
MIKYTTYNYVTKANEEHVVGVGTTMYVYTQTERIMSDVWESVTRVYYWDGERINSVALSYECYDAPVKYTIDADLDSILPQVEAQYLDANLNRRIREAEHEAGKVVVKGREVRVARGRKEVGKVGKVVSVKDGVYGTQLAIALDDTKGPITTKDGRQFTWYTNVIWIAAKNCDVANMVVDHAAVKHAAERDTALAMEALKNKINAKFC